MLNNQVDRPPWPGTAPPRPAPKKHTKTKPGSVAQCHAPHFSAAFCAALHMKFKHRHAKWAKQRCPPPAPPPPPPPPLPAARQRSLQFNWGFSIFKPPHSPFTPPPHCSYSAVHDYMAICAFNRISIPFSLTLWPGNYCEWENWGKMGINWDKCYTISALSPPLSLPMQFTIVN